MKTKKLSSFFYLNISLINQLNIFIMETIIEIIITAAAFFIGAQILKGVHVKSFVQAIIVAVVIGVLNFTLGTILKIVTLGILSLGIFTWLLDAILIQVADFFLEGFEVKNFWWALGLAAVVSFVSGLLRGLF
ncbi:MAG: phage holin family protein [Saprospiraceae bacterium]